MRIWILNRFIVVEVWASVRAWVHAKIMRTIIANWLCLYEPQENHLIIWVEHSGWCHTHAHINTNARGFIAIPLSRMNRLFTPLACHLQIATTNVCDLQSITIRQSIAIRKCNNIWNPHTHPPRDVFATSQPNISRRSPNLQTYNQHWFILCMEQLSSSYRIGTIIHFFSLQKIEFVLVTQCIYCKCAKSNTHTHTKKKEDWYDCVLIRRKVCACKCQYICICQ